MGTSFENPHILLLIPLFILFATYFSKFRFRAGNNGRRKTILGIRIIVFILMILALSGINIKTHVDTTTTIFAVDLSKSNEENQEDLRKFISESLKYAGKDDRVGVIAFGEKSEVEIPIVDKLQSINFQTKIKREFTNIEKALKLSRSLIPENSKKRIVLLTDGRENVGDSINEGNMLNINDIDLKIFKTEGFTGNEVQLKEIVIPKTVYENQSFDVILDIYSNVITNSKITLFSENNIVGEKEVSLEKGNNKFVFKDKALNSGFRSYRAVIAPENDTFTQNNTYSTFSNVKGKPNVLLIDGESKGGREINKILEAAAIGVDYVDSKEIPNQLSNLLKYKSIIMSDVSLHNIDKKFIEALQIYVRDYGGGLVVTGGENSYALGGYYKTKLEEILPVNMEMKIKGEVPSLGLMLVIDKSGSMEGGELQTSKIEMAKEAAIKAVNSLKPKDQIGVITFDDTPQWVVKPSPDQKEDKVKGDIQTIRAGGGTSIIPALNEAYSTLKEIDTKQKHIILLTDGQAERVGYDEVVNKMKEAGITISTVAVGEGSDVSLLERIAKGGKGRYYYVDEYSSIPEIFTKETFLASKTYINNRTFIPKIASSNQIVIPMMDRPIPLSGYISTSSKDRADIILYSDKDEPILALWQYGLGRSIAWTSDSNGKWTSDYLEAEEGIDFFTRMIQSTFYEGGSEELFVETKRQGNAIQISVTNLNDDERLYDMEATIITPELEKFGIDLNITDIDKYIGEFEASEKGTYIININATHDEEVIKSTQEAFTINYSKEYDITSSSGKLNNLIKKSKGTIIIDPNEVFTKTEKNVLGYTDISEILIIISLALFIIDIALRRLNIRFKKFKTIGENIQRDVDKKAKGNTKSTIKRKKISYKSNGFKNRNIEKTSVGANERSKDKNNEKPNINNRNTINTDRLLKAKNKRKK
ncbi:VWA domain-containing protein [Maledivibacter halophilus]|uniref:Mg-chelatase subunit ChlD n=1 Tax=Maledivibacter halophilus TaxID=36842 RepID=A0A1T5LC15_9FIRM|nr:VWA domain-containing protein [Maledivibacter halophilus]SKC72948.1 Mg-chelatase subunit ChlD [Maledivibacter halophilus]